eukprot:g6668.t1
MAAVAAVAAALDSEVATAERVASASSDAVSVYARIRPLNDMEKRKGRGICTAVSKDGRTVAVETDEDGGGGKVSFNFDRVFPPEVTQAAVFQAAAAGIVTDMLDGFNCTIFA